MSLLYLLAEWRSVVLTVALDIFTEASTTHSSPLAVPRNNCPCCLIVRCICWSNGLPSLAVVATAWHRHHAGLAIQR